MAAETVCKHSPVEVSWASNSGVKSEVVKGFCGHRNRAQTFTCGGKLDSELWSEVV